MLMKFLPLLKELGAYLKMGMDRYADLRAAGDDASPEIIAFFLQEKMASWDPQLNNTSLLDDDTKAAGARFLAGVAINFVRST